jgi:hypothetical protein
MSGKYDQKDAIIVALVRRIHGITRPGPAKTVFTPAEISRASQQHLEITWCENSLEVRVISDT